ncbi:integrase [Streptomyces vinaceus]|uniref:integrase n=1 Tax=Streptomyces vinaceus TaxID=1960 RepID=UPI0035D5437E
MTTLLGVEVDPYALPMPVPDSPVILPCWIGPGNEHPNARYQDDIWPMGPLIDTPGSKVHCLYWKNCPGDLRDELKLVTWTMLNGELRPTYVQSRSRATRTRDSAPVMRHSFLEWLRLARWLNERDVIRLGDCTAEHWRAYAIGRTFSGCSRDHARRILGQLSDLWAFDQLSARPSGIGRPPWDVEGVDDYLPEEASTGGGENQTEPLDETVIGPLLTWAIFMVEDLADDILAAWAERRRLTARAEATKGTPASRAALEAYLLPLGARDDKLLPATVGDRGGVTLARTFIAATTGASFKQVDRFAAKHGLTRLAAQRPGPCPLEVPITGRIEGRPWKQYIDFDEAPVLMRCLATAATIVILYLTGMRPQEVQGLRSGCCPNPEPNPDGTTPRHLIYSHHYKNVTDEDGNHVSAGEERKVPWVAIEPVVRAIRVLERIVPVGELLLSSAHQDFASQRPFRGALRAESLARRVEGFVAWANREADGHDLPQRVIPPDPLGAIGLARFRRTLAWHIARRPGGLVALAVQYGHMRAVLDARTSTGYGDRGRPGVHGVLDIETVRAAADTAVSLLGRTAAGEKISGQAARRALTGALKAPRFEGTLTTRQAATKAAMFLARDGIVLFENPDSFLICAFKRDTALCDPEPEATSPNQFACQLGCGNAVRTDAHAHALRDRADYLDRQAAHTPKPVGDRLRSNANRLRGIADAHDATAKTAEELLT